MAADSAVSVARTFVDVTLRRWAMQPLLDEAGSVVAELVMRAVAASREHEPLRVRLVGMPTSVGVEVWGGEPYPYEVPELGVRRGCYPAGTGKVMWVELAAPN